MDWDAKKIVLIITKLDESPRNKKTHYSDIKGYLLADGLINYRYK